MRAFALLVFALTSCGSLDFDLSTAVPESVLSGDSTTCTLNRVLDRAPVNPFQLNVDLKSETDARDTGPVSRVELRSLSLSITATKQPPGDVDNFDFLTSLEIFVESSTAGSKLPKVKVAAMPVVPRGASKIDVPPVSGVDLLPYINEGARLTSSASGSTPCDDTSIAGAVVIRAIF